MMRNAATPQNTAHTIIKPIYFVYINRKWTHSVRIMLLECYFSSNNRHSTFIVSYCLVWFRHFFSHTNNRSGKKGIEYEMRTFLALWFFAWNNEDSSIGICLNHWTIIDQTNFDRNVCMYSNEYELRLGTMICHPWCLHNALLKAIISLIVIFALNVLIGSDIPESNRPNSIQYHFYGSISIYYNVSRIPFALIWLN